MPRWLIHVSGLAHARIVEASVADRTAVRGSEQFVYRVLNRPFRRKEPLAVEPAAPSETDIDESGMN